jgi:hypothetical protein
MQLESFSATNPSGSLDLPYEPVLFSTKVTPDNQAHQGSFTDGMTRHNYLEKFLLPFLPEPHTQSKLAKNIEKIIIEIVFLPVKIEKRRHVSTYRKRKTYSFDIDQIFF